MARGFRELFIFAMVVSVPLFVGRAIYRLIAVAYPDLSMDLSESAADGVGILLVFISLLAYLVVRSVQFVRRRRGMATPSINAGAGVWRVIGLFAVTFFIAAIIDGFSKALVDGSRSFPATDHAAVVPPVPVIPPPVPDFPPIPDLAPLADNQPIPEGLTANGIARGVYACRIGFSNFFFTIKSDSECSTKDIGFGEAHDCTYSYDQTRGAIRVDNPVEPELQRNSLTYIPDGITGSKPDRDGPGIEASGLSLPGAEPLIDWCAFQGDSTQ